MCVPLEVPRSSEGEDFPLTGPPSPSEGNFFPWIRYTVLSERCVHSQVMFPIRSVKSSSDHTINSRITWASRGIKFLSEDKVPTAARSLSGVPLTYDVSLLEHEGGKIGCRWTRYVPEEELSFFSRVPKPFSSDEPYNIPVYSQGSLEYGFFL